MTRDRGEAIWAHLPHHHYRLGGGSLWYGENTEEVYEVVFLHRLRIPPKHTCIQDFYSL